MSWKPEVLAVGDDKWVTNGLRFATKEEAEAYALDLSLHYTMVRDTRAVEVDDPVNYTYHDHQLRPVEGITVTATRMLDHDENQLELPFGRVIGRRLAVKHDKRWSPGPSAFSRCSGNRDFSAPRDQSAALWMQPEGGISAVR